MYDHDFDQHAYSGVSFNTFMTQSFGVMFLGVLLTAITAYFGTPILRIFLQLGASGLMLIYFIQLGVTFYFSSRLMKMSKTTAYVCFYIYSFLTGITLSTIPLYYGGETLGISLFITAGMFGCMAIIGHTSKVDFTKFAPYMVMGLFGIIIMTLVNGLFIQSSGTSLLIDYAVIVIFLFMIAFDMQNLKRMHLMTNSDPTLAEKMAIFGAFQLYLDFINIFLRVLSITGRSRDN